jgi:fatty-acyl-CoA synthase/long-chain acyl-CoA synthetase
MIITGGMNVYSTQVEDVLARHPGIQKVAVIGIPHERWGEAVHAVVEPYESEDIDESSIMEFAEEHLADYKRPKSVDFVDRIPETPYGKMDKKNLRSRYWDENDRSVS